MEIIAQISATISPIIAVILAYKLNKYSEKRMKDGLIETEIRKEKMDILKILMAARSYPDWRYFQALNIIEVIFADNQSVRTAWKELLHLYKEPKSDDSAQFSEIEKKQIKLIETISDDLGYKGKITWEHISEKYSPVFMARQIDAQYALNNIVTKMSKLLDGQDASPMINAMNKFSESINNIVNFIKSLKDQPQEAIDKSIEEESK